MMLAELSKTYGVHATQIGTWKRAAIENMATAFTRRGSVPQQVSACIGDQYIGPDTIFDGDPTLVRNDDVGCADRDSWRIIHESRRLDTTLQAYKDWIDRLFE